MDYIKIQWSWDRLAGVNEPVLFMWMLAGHALLIGAAENVNEIEPVHPHPDIHVRVAVGRIVSERPTFERAEFVAALLLGWFEESVPPPSKARVRGPRHLRNQIANPDINVECDGSPWYGASAATYERDR